MKKQSAKNNSQFMETAKAVFFYVNKESLSNKKRWIPVLILPIFFVYMEIFLRIFTKTAVLKHLIFPVLFGFSLGLFLTGFLLWMPKKVSRIGYLLIMLFTAIIFLVECFVFRAFKLYMPISTVLGGAQGVATNYSKSVIGSIVGGILSIVVFLLPGVLFFRIGGRLIPKKKYLRAFCWELIAAGLLLFLLTLALVFVSGNGKKYSSRYEYDNATQTFGLVTSSRLEFKYKLTGKKRDSYEAEPVTEQTTVEEASETPSENVMDIDFAKKEASTSDPDLKELDRYAPTVTPSTKNAYTGLFEGKNLILICAEALSDKAIIPELTPTLYRMMHNGFYFSEYYQPSWGGSTITGEVSFLTGLVPNNSVDTIYALAENNTYFTLGNQLQRLGYYSAAFHDSDYDYYERNTTHTTFGYDTWLGYGNGLEDITGLWTGDSALLDKTVDTYIDKQPFSIYYMTVSGHFPYDDENLAVAKYYDRVKEVVGDSYSETVINYLATQMELEDGLNALIAKLEQKGIADNTVICVTADHYPYGLTESAAYGNSEDYLTELYGGPHDLPWDQSHNALLIWSGCLENEKKEFACEVSTPVYSLDIVPTLSNLFGLEYDSRLLVGRDVFSDAEPLVIWRNYSWVTERGKYDSAEDTFYPNPGFSEDQEYIDRISKLVSNRIRYSSDIIDCDFYGHLFGPDKN